MLDMNACYGAYFEFFCVFSYITDEHSCLKHFIFTKLYQIMCLTDVQILICRHAKFYCKLWQILNIYSIMSFGNFTDGLSASHRSGNTFLENFIDLLKVRNSMIKVWIFTWQFLPHFCIIKNIFLCINSIYFHVQCNYFVCLI